MSKFKVGDRVFAMDGGKPYYDRLPTKTEREALNRAFVKFIPYLGEA